MRRAAYWTLAGLLMVSSAMSAAQLPVVRQSEMGRKGSAKAFRNLDDFAACVVKHGNADTATFLGSDFPPKHMDSGGMFLANKYDNCLRGTFLLSMHPPYLRGALIEAEYHRLSSGTASERPIALGRVTGADEELPSALAECLVRAQPEASKRLLDTQPASPEQNAAFNAYGADFTTCARASGVTTAPPQLLRYQIAEALYRRAAANPATERGK
jgi:hypothetical protein